MIETVRVSQQAKDQLITLKRRTGIANWNVLCRWALCLSLAEDSDPPMVDIVTDSSIEMTWRTFGGDGGELYSALCMWRKFGLGSNVMNDTVFSAHLHRGIGYLLEFDCLDDLFVSVVKDF